MINNKKIIAEITWRWCNLSITNFFEAMKSMPVTIYIPTEIKEACQMAIIPITIVEVTSSPFILIIQIFCNLFYGSNTQ